MTTDSGPPHPPEEATAQLGRPPAAQQEETSGPGAGFAMPWPRHLRLVGGRWGSVKGRRLESYGKVE